MNEKEIFDRLLSLIGNSDDNNGVVGACLVRDGKILNESVSMANGVHAEYSLLRRLEDAGVSINPDDVVYVTVEPCGKRTPSGSGEKMGDCTSNLIKAGVKHVIYAATDPDASLATRHKFQSAGVTLLQVKDKEIISKSIEAFNSTCDDPKHWLPLV